MQVEPRTMIDEEELPDDLAALASQLQGEANGLAECYPAGQIHPVLKEVLAVQLKEHDRSRRVRSGIIAALVPLLILVGSAVLLVTSQLSDTPAESDNSHAVPETPSITSSGILAVATQQTETPGEENTPSANREWSEPELEGLIDIWDQDKTLVRRVSF